MPTPSPTLGLCTVRAKARRKTTQRRFVGIAKPPTQETPPSSNLDLCITQDKARDDVANKLTPQQLGEAQLLATEWRTKNE